MRSQDDPDGIALCFDTYEVVISGYRGSKDQYAADALPTTAVAYSLPGQIPSIGISYDQAEAACQNTPVLDRNGELVGFKRIALSGEWQDAWDGQIGAGGTCYPYGNTYEESACATLTSSGQAQYYDLQPTGSLERCVSRWGIYDLLGNAWEWADSGIRINIESWFALARRLGADVQVDSSGFLFTGNPAVANQLKFEIAGVQPPVQVDGQGYLAQSSEMLNPDVPLKGYLKFTSGVSANDPANFLPIQLRLTDQASSTLPYRTYLLTQDDGAVVPDKLGSAYYAGSSTACSSQSSQLVHFHDFDGTINLRCVSEPLY